MGIILVLLVIVGVFCFFIGSAYMKRDGAPKQEAPRVADNVVVSQDSIIIPRSASVKIIIRDADPADISDNDPAPFDIECEEEELNYVSDWQRLFAFDTPMEERRLIYETLQEGGMYFLAPFEQLFPDSVEAAVPDSEGSFDEPDAVTSGGGDSQEKEEPGTESEPETTGEEEEDGDTEVEPDDHTETVNGSADGGSADEPEERVDEDGRIIYDPANETLLEEAERERQEEVDEERGISWDYSEADYSDDNAAVLKAISLMTFITDSLKKGLISPELARFAETRLQLKAADDAWNNLLLDQAQARMAKFTDLDVSIDELDRMVHEDVDSHSAAAEPAVDVQASGDQSRRRPSEPKFKTTRIDTHGGQMDAVWDRLIGK